MLSGYAESYRELLQLNHYFGVPLSGMASPSGCDGMLVPYLLLKGPICTQHHRVYVDRPDHPVTEQQMVYVVFCTTYYRSFVVVGVLQVLVVPRSTSLYMSCERAHPYMVVYDVLSSCST
jgi:hypothetical protein